ncbi:hypothetical protein [Paracoccus sp. (in: a-proteobacteria)]|uniref:hypothetical protein n=1 Tax=Paracoccus sp. TaxID=267 RepID=UPI0032205A97
MKTATTSIQAWLDRHSPWLAGQGWIYPGWPLRAAPRIEARIAGLAADQNLVISDEGLWHFAGSPRSDTQRIAGLLADFDVTVIVYCRRPDHFLEAWFKQGLKHGLGAPDVSRFLASPATGSQAFRDRLELFAGLFGESRLVVAPYERAQMQGGDIIADFLARSGLPVPGCGAGDRDGAASNVSPPADVMLMAGLLRQVFNLGQAQIDELLATAPHAVIAAARSTILSPEEAARIREDYRPLFHDIQQRFGTGAEPGFFLDWGDDVAAPAASPLRAAYDAYLARTTGG